MSVSLLFPQTTRAWAAPREASQVRLRPSEAASLLLRMWRLFLLTFVIHVCLRQPASDAASACVGSAFTALLSWLATPVALATVALPTSPMRRWFATSGSRRTLPAWLPCSVRRSSHFLLMMSSSVQSERANKHVINGSGMGSSG